MSASLPITLLHGITQSLSQITLIGIFIAVARAQALLVAEWMSIGFILGVMFTDNTTISGETIDYGPCAFMDVYYRHGFQFP